MCVSLKPDSDSDSGTTLAIISVPIPVPILHSFRTRFRFRFRDSKCLELDSDSETIPSPDPRVSVFRFRDERTGNLCFLCTYCCQTRLGLRSCLLARYDRRKRTYMAFCGYNTGFICCSWQPFQPGDDFSLKSQNKTLFFLK